MSVVYCHGKAFESYISADTIRHRCESLAHQIEADYLGKVPLFLVVLNGAFMFASELIRHYRSDCEVSFVKLASYSGTQSTGKIKELIGLNEDLSGREVIIVEDIVDTGFTMEAILKQLEILGVSSVQIASLLFKPESLQTQVDPRYVGFEVEPHFYLGFGLDYDGLGRNLDHLYRLKNS